MEKQLQLRRDRLNAGEKSIGWKVGFGSPAAMERLHLDAPLIGFLTDKTILPSGTKLSVANWTRPAIEPEIAVYIEKDLLGKTDRQTASSSIASVGPAIELADVFFPPDDVEMILASNIYNRHVILGRADASRTGGILNDLVGRIYRNGNEIAKTTDLQALTGDIIDIVCHIAGLLSAMGERLQAGEAIIMGSIISPIWIESTGGVQYTLDPIGSLSVDIEV